MQVRRMVREYACKCAGWSGNTHASAQDGQGIRMQVRRMVREYACKCAGKSGNTYARTLKQLNAMAKDRTTGILRTF